MSGKAIRATVLCGIAGMAGAMNAAPACAQPQAYYLDIPAQNLGDALRALGRATRQQLVFSGDAVQGKRSVAVKGSYPAREALDLLLAHSGLSVETGAGGVFMIKPAKVQIGGPLPVPATGEREGALEGEGILVTARKRAESIQTVPLSVTAVDAATLERNFITTVDQIGLLVPNVRLQPISNNPTNLAPYIRGIGTRSGEPSQEAPVAISIDGVYLSQVAGSLIDIFDVEQIEVLRGPQGSLQGRNASGGAINITTRRPSGSFGARAEVSYERFDRIEGKVALEAPLQPGLLAIKLSAFYADGGGYMKDVNTRTSLGGVERWGGRIGILLTPAPNFTSYFTADYIRDTSPQAALRGQNHLGARGPRQPQPTACTLYGICSEAPKYTSEQNYVDHNSSRNGGLALTSDWKLGPVTLTSVTGYRFVNEDVHADVDTTKFTVFHALLRGNEVRAFSQELRLASNGTGPFDYVAGLYFIRSRYNLDARNQLGGKIFGTAADRFTAGNRNQVAKSYAAFGQASYHITDGWSLSAGARQTWDRKKGRSTPSLTGPTGGLSARFSNFSVEAGTEYRLSTQGLAYFRFSQGYRSGGINGAAATLAGINSYKPETVNSFEVGLKTEWLDRRLTANVAAFTYDYKDLQITAVDQTPVGTVSRVVNARCARISGAEFEGAFRPTPHLTFTGALGYLDVEYKSDILNLGFGPQDIRGLRHEYAPHWSGYLAADYVVPLGGHAGQIVLSADTNFTSAFAMNPVDNPIGAQSGYGLVNGSITYQADDKAFRVSLFGQNLTNKYYTDAGEASGGFANWVHVRKPITYGIRVSARL